MIRLCLGTANFGSKYGLDNKKINKNELSKIIDIAKKNQLMSIDTSFEYLNSHQNLKKVIDKKMNINTKILLKKKFRFVIIKKKDY